MNNLPITTVITIVAVISIIAIASLVFILQKEKKKGSLKKPNTLIPSGIVLFAVAIMVAYCISPIMTGFNKGMNHVKWTKLSLSEITDINSKTPDEDKLPSDTKGSIIILYKYGCPDCSDIYDDLNKAIKDNNTKVYFITSGSPEGQKFVQDGNITNVPTAIYVRNEPLANGATFNSVQLYSLDVHDKPYFNEQAFNRLVLLQEKQR